MTEEPKEKQSGDYQFINEKIVPKRRSKWLKKLGTTLFVAFLAVIFGVVSQAAFLLSGEYLKEWLGIEKERQEVDLPKPTDNQPRATISPTAKPIKTQSPAPTKSPTEAAVPTQQPEEDSSGKEPTPGAELTPEATPAGAGNEEPEATVAPEKTPEENNGAEHGGNSLENQEIASKEYLQMYESIRNVAEEVSNAFVTVEAIEQGVDWFQEVYENRTRTTGLVLGNDGVDLLILVGTEQFSGATSIEVSFDEVVVAGSIYSMDRDYGLAVIAVPLAEIPEHILNNVTLGILAETDEIVVGTPVLALGAPNGYEGSMEFGMITSLGSTVSVTDGEVAYFTTNIMEYPGGYGFVVNLEGKILGMITHTHKANQSDGIFSAVSLDSIRGVIVKLLNNAERAWFGIKGQNLPKNVAKEYELETGVYVSEVENASPALGAGIKAGDILISVGNQPVDGIRVFSDVILECSTREIVQVKLLRKAEDGLREMTVEVALTGKK